MASVLFLQLRGYFCFDKFVDAHRFWLDVRFHFHETCNALVCANWRWELKLRPLAGPWWIKSGVRWSAVSPRARHGERISCSKTCLSPKQQQRCSGWVYVYWLDHGKPVAWALHSSRGSCQSFGSIFVCLVPGGGVVSSSLECLLWVTYVDLPILHSLAPVAMATRAVNAATNGESLRIIHGNGHTRVNPNSVCACVCASPKLAHWNGTWRG